MPRPAHKRAWWRQTIAEFERSGMSASAFAAQRDLHVDTFKWWRSAIGREPATADLVRVEVVEPVPAAVAVLEARVGAAELRFEAGTDVHYVGALVAAIARAARC